MFTLLTILVALTVLDIASRQKDVARGEELRRQVWGE